MAKTIAEYQADKARANAAINKLKRAEAAKLVRAKEGVRSAIGASVIKAVNADSEGDLRSLKQFTEREAFAVELAESFHAWRTSGTTRQVAPVSVFNPPAAVAPSNAQSVPVHA